LLNLGKVEEGITQTLEKISSREKYLSGQFESEISRYRILHEQTLASKRQYENKNQQVNTWIEELAQLSNDLDDVKVNECFLDCIDIVNIFFCEGND